MKYTLLLQGNKAKPDGNYFCRALLSLVSGTFLGFLFSLMIVSNGKLNGINDLSDNWTANTKNITQINGNLADFLQNELKILCVVMTEPDAIESRTQFIQQTWGKRCSKLIHISIEPNPLIPDIVVIKENYTYARTRATFKYVYKHYLNDFDWFLKVDDDNYFIMENLRYLLYQYSTDWPLALGQKYLDPGYLMGPYILSKTALIYLVERAFANPQYCPDMPDIGSDGAIHECLQNVNVITVDVNKEKGKFFYESLEVSLFPNHEGDADRWYWFKLKQGIDQCCSEYPIFFRFSWYVHFFYIDYLVYKVEAFGRIKNPEKLPDKLNLENVIKNL